MMLLSRFWYAILAVLAGFAVYSLMLAVGQYNRVSVKGTDEALAADSNVVRWDIQIDSRRRIDALLVLSLDKSIQDSLVATLDKDKIPQKSRDDAHKALAALQEKIPAQWRPDATFVVDRDGRVVAELGYPAADKYDDFDLGGYSSVNDAIHGWLRDDTWVWGGQVYLVAARPVERDESTPPVGAVVGLRAMDRKYAMDVVKDTQTNVVFYAQGQKVAAAGVAATPTCPTCAFDETIFDQVAPELPKLDADATYKEKGHTEIRTLPGNVGVVFSKLDGDAFELGAGYAVMRTRSTIQGGATTFLANADDTDKKNVSWPPLIAIVFAGLVFGVLLTFVEHDRPLAKMRQQATKLRKGEIDLLQLAALSGALRDVGNEINAGIERVAEKGGGAPRKPADLEAILGPTPAEPAMSAFAFPLAEPPSAVRQSNPVPPPASNPKPIAMGPHNNTPPVAPVSSPSMKAVVKPQNPAMPNIVAPPMQGLQQPTTSPTTVMVRPTADGPSANPQAHAAPPRPVGPAAPLTSTAATAVAPPPQPHRQEDEEERTMVASVPQEVLARASGEMQNPDEGEWPTVYEDFLKTKKQCNEPTEGLTLEKFRQTLRKNRDALVTRHNCKRVKFTVYVKDGRASLKATPIKD
jgi:hypothetical protein